MVLYIGDVPVTNVAAGSINYEFDYYSASQISIMMGDVLIDTVVSIDFNVQQSKAPIYGYAQQYASFYADGKVIVQGQLAIAFKETGYLLWPIKRFIERSSIGKFTSPKFQVLENGVQVPGSSGAETFRTASSDARDKEVMKMNVETMAQFLDASHEITDSDLSKEEKTASRIYAFDAFNTYWKDLGAMDDDKFEDYAEAFEDAIWYGSDRNSVLRDKLYSYNLTREELAGAGEYSIESVYSHRRADQYPPVDIWIMYGNHNMPHANHTVKKLLDVSFLGQSQTITVSGDPIYEIYPFIARNLV